jgi:hypothetical protein
MKISLIILSTILLFSCTKNNSNSISVNYAIYNGAYEGYIYSEKIETIFTPNYRIDTLMDTAFVSYNIKLNSTTLEIINTSQKYQTGIVDSSVLNDSIQSVIDMAHYGKDYVVLTTKDSMLYKEYAYYGQGSGFYSFKYKYALKKRL